jgi:hypothetical protein
LLYDQHLVQPLLANLNGGIEELFALAGEHGVVVTDAPVYVAAAKWFGALFGARIDYNNHSTSILHDLFTFPYKADEKLQRNFQAVPADVRTKIWWLVFACGSSQKCVCRKMPEVFTAVLRLTRFHENLSAMSVADAEIMAELMFVLSRNANLTFDNPPTLDACIAVGTVSKQYLHNFETILKTIAERGFPGIYFQPRSNMSNRIELMYHRSGVVTLPPAVNGYIKLIFGERCACLLNNVRMLMQRHRVRPCATRRLLSK